MNKMAPYMKGGRRAVNLRSTLPSYKEGGLVDAAEKVRQGGRHKDVHLVHINDEEFEHMRKQFGDPIINPNTGIPEWGFLDTLKNIVKKVAIAAAMYYTGGAIGGAIGGTALGGALGAAGSNALGGAIVGGAVGGKKGAIMGGIGSYVGTPTEGGGGALDNFGGSFLGNASPETRTMIGRGVLGGGGAALTGDDPLEGALGAVALGGVGDKIAGSDFVQNGLANNSVLQQGALGAAKGIEIAGVTGADPEKAALIGGGLGAAANAIQKWGPQKPATPETPAYDSPKQEAYGVETPKTVPRGTLDIAGQGFGATLSGILPQMAGYKTKDEALTALDSQTANNPDQRPVYEAMKNFTVCDLSDNFGACMAQHWDDFNASIAKNAPKMAEGGSVLDQYAGERGRIQDSDFAHEGAVRGPGDGQDDLVPINAANGEFVIPSDVVSAAGSGSSDAGAKAFDDMVRKIRTHARSTSPKKLPPKAKSPLEYLNMED